MIAARSDNAQRLSTGMGVAGPCARTLLSDAEATETDAGSVAVAMLTSGLVVMPTAKRTGSVNTRRLPAPAAIVAPVTVNVVPPEIPVTVPHVAVPDGTQVAVADSVTPAGRLSVTVTLLAFDGPLLVTVIV